MAPTHSSRQQVSEVKPIRPVFKIPTCKARNALLNAIIYVKDLVFLLGYIVLYIVNYNFYGCTEEY